MKMLAEKLAGYYSAEDEEIKAKAKEIEVLLDDVGEKINTTKNLASQTRIPQEKNHVLSVEKQLGKIDEEILKQQGMLMGESEEELGVDKESESISPAGSLQAEGENFGEAGRKQPKQAVFEVDDDRTARGFYLTVNYGQRLKADRLLEKLHNFHREGYYEEDEAILDKLEKLKTVLTIQAPESRFGQKQKFKERGDVFVGKTYEGPFGDPWVDKKGNVNKTSYGELENAEAENFGEEPLATLKAHARKDNLLYRVSDDRRHSRFCGPI